MTMSDPIADMLTRIRNANTAKHDTVDVPASKMKLAIVQILLDEGYIKKYDILDEGSFKTIHIISGPCHAGHMLQQDPGITFRIRNPRRFQFTCSFLICFLIGHSFYSSSLYPKFSLKYAFQSNTASTDAIPTSIISSSGSFVVSPCSQSPGLLKIHTIGFSLLPAHLISS